jgi:hypothetical protein
MELINSPEANNGGGGIKIVESFGFSDEFTCA